MSYSPTETPPVVDVTMPQLGVSMAEGAVSVWHKRAGDWVAADEIVCEITTDKIDSEIPAPASGRIAEICVEVDQTVPVGAVLARIHTDVPAGEAHPDEQLDARAQHDEPDGATQAPNGATQRHDGPAQEQEGAAQPLDGAAQRHVGPAQEQDGAAQQGDDRAAQHYSPVVRRIAEREGVDLTQVQGSGRGGRVRKQDVLAFVEQRGGRDERREDEQPPLHTESPYREPDQGERLSRMRRSIAEHMVRSLRTAAHCTSIVEADMSAVQAARESLGLTYLPFVARATIDALRAHPELNATLEGETLAVHRSVNLGIAVSLGSDGLVVPVIHDAQDLSHEGLARRIADLARRAREGELNPDDVHGGTFTITNPGALGTLMSTPIINQPQVAILDLEAVVKRAVVVAGADGQDSIAIRPMTNLCLSWDHRALDGALAAQFLATLRERIERWGRS